MKRTDCLTPPPTFRLSGRRLNNKRFFLTPLTLACLLVFGSPSYANGDPDGWQALSAKKQYTVTINGSSKQGETINVGDKLTNAGNFGIIEFYYHGIKGSDSTSKNHLTIGTENSEQKSINIDMTDKATAGVYVARRNYNANFGSENNTPSPELTFNKSLNISGNLNNKINNKSGQTVSGITVANSSLKVNGDLSITLDNMGPDDNTVVKSDWNIPDINQLPWDLIYGWSSLDQAEKSDSPHNLNLLQSGIAAGFSKINITGNASINVSGRHGLLTGWYWAPNSRTYTSPNDLSLIDQGLKHPTTIGGDLTLKVSQHAAGYGAYGLLWENSGDSSNLPPMKAHIGGTINIIVTAAGYDNLDLPTNSYKLEEYTGKIAGIFANKNVDITATKGIQSQAAVSQQSTVDNIYGTFLQTNSKITTTSGINTEATITNDLTYQTMHAKANEEVSGLYLNDNSSISGANQIVSNANAIGNITATRLYGTFLQNKSQITGATEIYTKATINNNLVKKWDQTTAVPPAESNEISGLYVNNSSISATNQIVSKVDASDFIIVDKIYGTFLQENSEINTGLFSTAVSISAGNSFEATVTEVDGLYVNQGGLSATTGISSRIQVQENSTVSNIYGIYLNDQSKLETPEIISTVEIDENAEVTNAVGLSIAEVTDTSLVNASVAIAGNAENICGINLSNSALSVSENLTIDVGQPSKNQSRPIALRMEGASNFAVNQAKQGQVSLSGDIVASADSNVNIAFGTGGTFTGAANIADGTDASSGISLDFSAGGSWSVNGNSAVTQLTLGNGSIVDLGLYDYTQNTTADALGFGSSTLDIHNFVSLRDSPGVFLFHLDNQSGKQQSGLVSLVGEVDPTNNFAEIMLTDNGSGFSAEKSNYLIRQASSAVNKAEFALVDQPGIGQQTQLGVYLYALRPFDDGSGYTYWCAEKTGTVAPPIEDTVSMASYSTQITHYLARLSDLRQRLGDVRYYGSNGLWTTVKGSNEHLTGLASSSFEIDTYGINVGWDGTDPNGWTYGLYGRYFMSDQKAKQPYHYTNGESESWGLSLYLSRAFENNAYIDLVASYDHFDQELKGQLSDGMTRFKTDYDTHGYGVSAEAGFQHALTDDGLFLLEPSVQLSYYRVEGQDFKLTKGISVSESSVDSLTGRAGVNLVRKFMRNGEKVGEFYAKAGVNYEFMGEQSISANEAKFEGDLLGLRYYYGLGASMKLRPDLYGWIQFAREEGDDYTKEYEGTAGIRWVF